MANSPSQVNELSLLLINLLVHPATQFGVRQDARVAVVRAQVEVVPILVMASLNVTVFNASWHFARNPLQLHHGVFLLLLSLTIFFVLF